LSDIEVTHQDKAGYLWHIAYRGEGVDIIVATTRPETLFGDTAVAVHPDDSRYRHLIGKTVRIPFAGRDIPIVGDTAVDPAFGTGAVKVTPAHDPNDFGMGQRHNLEQIVVMDEGGAMTDAVPVAYRGLDRAECRARLVNDLETAGFLISTQAHALSVGHCSRCNTIVEPYLSYQWFVRMRPLAEPAMRVVTDESIRFYPRGRWEKLYFNWMENIRDWCISRQIWWGHQIPVWYCACAPHDPIVSEAVPTVCPRCHGHELAQDPDVLDTWFSSALWPFSTLGWPEKTTDLKTFYPTSVLITGYDIITFWVSRMIVMGLFQMTEKPFEDVYIHGLVRDKDGKKMSKSIGNVIDPLALIDSHGADALRYCLASLSTLGGQDITFSDDRLLAGKHFANKLWNAARFVQMSVIEDAVLPPGFLPPVTHIADRWILSRLTDTVSSVEAGMATYNFAAIAESVWEFAWNDFCDWYLEMAKSRKAEATPVLVFVLTTLMRVLHPVMPFVSEALWQAFYEKGWVSEPDLIVAPWPVLPAIDDAGATALMTMTMSVVREIRHVRKSVQVPQSVRCKVILEAPDSDMVNRLREAHPLICQLAGLSDCEITSDMLSAPEGCAASVAEQIKIYLPLAGVIDMDRERKRLADRHGKLVGEMAHLYAKLANDGFVSNAPEAVVQKIRDQWAGLQADAEKIQEQLAVFGG
jgi:valyl-tRNA synthetase